MSFTQEQITKWGRNEDGVSLYLDLFTYPNGKQAYISVFNFTFGVMYDLNEDGSAKHRCCYKSYFEARCALQAWDGEGDPSGYIVKKY